MFFNGTEITLSCQTSYPITFYILRVYKFLPFSDSIYLRISNIDLTLLVSEISSAKEKKNIFISNEKIVITIILHL